MGQTSQLLTIKMLDRGKIRKLHVQNSTKVEKKYYTNNNASTAQTIYTD